MIGQTYRSFFQTVQSWLFGVFQSFQCRRRKKKILLTAIGVSFLLGIILALNSYTALYAKDVLNAQLLSAFTATEKQNADSINLPLFDLQSVLRLENYTSSDPSSLGGRESHSEVMAPICDVAKQLKLFVSPPKVTVIYSLHKIASMRQALVNFRRNFLTLSSGVTDDVIITADASLPETDQEQLDDVVGNCDVCRLFFFNGTIYEQWNLASNFARRDLLVFIDGRVQLFGDWLQQMIVALDVEERIVSPKLQLITADGTIENVGTAVHEVQWDLTVARASPGVTAIQRALKDNVRYISQTVITKEVFLVRKSYFKGIGQFDTSSVITGSEHVIFSLKVLSCGGDIVVSMCSTSSLTIPGKDANPSYPYTDYYSPTFSNNLEEYTSRLQLDAIANVFLDSFSLRYHRCVDHDLNLTSYRPTAYPTRSPLMQIRAAHMSPTRQKTKLEQYLHSNLRSMKCLVKNFKHILKYRQPGMVAPTKFATFYGYIRTIDGLWAVGLQPGSSEQLLNATYPSSALTKLDGKLVLTRNTSLWLGPFSFTNGAFIYMHKWCLTALPSSVFTLTKCMSGTSAQLFGYAGDEIRQEGKTVCAAVNANISNPLFLSLCSEKNFTSKFKLDTRFVKGCIT